MQQQIITIAPLPVSEKKTRAAAYVRVSTNKDDQLNSFAAQYIHYKKLLEESISEELVDVYADEGISGTTTKERDAFNKLISDCEQGKIDRIYTKSISRFARNTTECLKYVRYLKSLGVTIYFEKENLDTSSDSPCSNPTHRKNPSRYPRTFDSVNSTEWNEVNTSSRTLSTATTLLTTNWSSTRKKPR